MRATRLHAFHANWGVLGRGMRCGASPCPHPVLVLTGFDATRLAPRPGPLNTVTTQFSRTLRSNSHPQAFLDALEGRCQARTALERLRGSAAWASFAKRWNTSVYFSLLYQEIAGGWVRKGAVAARWLV